tara:strand:+ start:814 stop:1008 length:195 start_codon:yes stop_codon:yes gene_type:complete
MTKKTLTLSIDKKVYDKLQKFKKRNPEFNISYRVEQWLIGELKPKGEPIMRPIPKHFGNPEYDI